MATAPEHDTLICLFHHTDRAERTVQELLELGIPENAITLIGHARETADLNTGTVTLDKLSVPDADRKRLMDGLRSGGSIVAVSADSSMAAKIEAIFKEYSADKIDEQVLSTTNREILDQGTTVDASAFPSTLTDERVDLPPVSRVVTMDPPIVETVSADDLYSPAAGADAYRDEPIEAILLVSEPAPGFTRPSETVTTEEALILLEPTDLVEDTDLVEPRSGSSSAVTTGRFDPNAPIDNVRNPAADRLNDPLNRR